jgi:5-methylcytosine-specific restriction endonuclease McrA
VEYSRYRAKVWREANRDKHAINNKIWKARNPSKNTANTARYKSKKLSATPSWLDAIQLAQIEEFYDIAVCRTMQTGVQHHVDHIIPLQGNGVSGLHVPWNLQVLTAFENISKKNKMIEVPK